MLFRCNTTRTALTVLAKKEIKIYGDIDVLELMRFDRVRASPKDSVITDELLEFL